MVAACDPGPATAGRWWRRLLPVLRWGTVAVLLGLLVLDQVFPLPLPGQRDTATLVVAADGTPLRAFADDQGCGVIRPTRTVCPRCTCRRC